MRRAIFAVVVAVVLLAAPTAQAGLFIPISGSDTILAPPPATDDASFGPLALGFSFSYFGGAAQTSVFYNSNGNLTFGAGNSSFSNVGFPSGSAGNMIAPFWNDVVVPPGDLRTNALTPGVFVAIWNEVGFFGQGGQFTAEAALFGAGNPYGFAPGSILFSYGTVETASTFWGSGATVGLNSSGGSSATLFPLGIGESDGTMPPAPAMSLSDRHFLFTPDGAGGYTVSEISPTAVPAPANMLLLGVGAAASALGWARRRCWKKA